MLTQKDINLLKGIFATKDELKQATKNLLTRNEFFNRMDILTKEIKNARYELKAHSTSHTRINDDINDHDSSIEKLEKHAGITPAL